MIRRHPALLFAGISSSETKLTGKSALYLYPDTIARILGWFLHLSIAFREGSLMFSVKESQFL